MEPSKERMKLLRRESVQKIPSGGRSSLAKRDSRSFSECMREIRKRHGISQEKLAFEAGRSESTIWKHEGGEAFPTFEFVRDVTESIPGITVGEIFTLFQSAGYIPRIFEHPEFLNAAKLLGNPKTRDAFDRKFREFMHNVEV